jgi:3-methyladenine DNA glycosylase AlkD
VYLGRREDAERWFPRVAAIVLRLSGDREASIPKAISWVLRSHLRHARQAVATFLEEHGGDLPAVARRETENKMTTGHKSGKPRRGP